MISKHVAARLGEVMHEVWLEDYRTTSGDAPRFKPVKDPAIPDMALAAVKDEKTGQITKMVYKDKTLDVSERNLHECRLSGTGALEQNIAQPAARLNPALHHRLNGALAEKYVDACAGILVSPNAESDLRKISSKIHEVWMEENKDWAPASQMKPFRMLSPDEQAKDVRIAQEMCKIAREEAEREAEASSPAPSLHPAPSPPASHAVQRNFDRNKSAPM